MQVILIDRFSTIGIATCRSLLPSALSLSVKFESMASMSFRSSPPSIEPISGNSTPTRDVICSIESIKLSVASINLPPKSSK